MNHFKFKFIFKNIIFPFFHTNTVTNVNDFIKDNIDLYNMKERENYVFKNEFKFEMVHGS